MGFPEHGDKAFLKMSLTIPDDGPTIVLGDAAIEKLSSRAPRPSSVQKDFVQTQKDTMVYVSPDLDALISSHFEEPRENDKTASVSGNDKIQNKPNKTSALMDNGKLYRLIIYNAGGTTLISNTSIQAGEDPDMYLTPGTPYRWVAFSVNSETDLPNINTSNQIIANDLENKDLLYASGTFTPSVGTNYLNIIFERKTARIVIDLNTRGIFGPIQDDTAIEIGQGTPTSTTSFTSIIEKGTFNVLSNTFSAKAKSSPITAANMTVIDPIYGNTMKRAVFYTITPLTSIAADRLRLRLNQLKITLDNGDTRTFAPNTMVRITHASTSLPIGSSSMSHVRLVESGVSVGTRTWARTNLIYDPDHPDKYRLLPNNDAIQPDIINHYWNFNVRTPIEQTLAVWNSQTGVPPGMTPVIAASCSRIYPSNTWVLPSIGHYEELLSRTNTKVNTIQNSMQKYAVVWARNSGTSANTAYPDNSLVLPLLGFRNINQTIITGHSKDVTANGQVARGQYMTSTYHVGTLRYAVFEITAERTSSGAIWDFEVYKLTPSTSLHMHEGRPSRCVRGRFYP